MKEHQDLWGQQTTQFLCFLRATRSEISRVCSYTFTKRPKGASLRSFFVGDKVCCGDNRTLPCGYELVNGAVFFIVSVRIEGSYRDQFGPKDKSRKKQVRSIFHAVCHSHSLSLSQCQLATIYHVLNVTPHSLFSSLLFFFFLLPHRLTPKLRTNSNKQQT